MSPVQLHCIGRRMTLPIASSGRQIIILYMSLHVQSFRHVHVCRVTHVHVAMLADSIMTLCLCMMHTVYIHVHVHVHVYIYMNERFRRKEERSKQGQTNNKAKQHSTTNAVTFQMSCLPYSCIHACVHVHCTCIIYTMSYTWIY